MATINMTVQTRNNMTNETDTISITYINPALFPSTGTIPMSSYQAADRVGRAIAALSNNVYYDTIITRTESTTEKINA